jgi:hypothetical protein
MGPMRSPETRSRVNPRSIYYDGAEIPLGEIEGLFRLPPGVSLDVHRKVLLIGSKGSGKSTFLRFQQQTYPGLALRVDLPYALGALAQVEGRGALDPDAEVEGDAAVEGKAACLLGLAICEHFSRINDEPIDGSIISLLVPSQLLPTGTTFDVSGIEALRQGLLSHDSERFLSIHQSRPLSEMITRLAESSERPARRLLLLMDRADMIALPAVRAASQVLDQGGSYNAVIATRPGARWPAEELTQYGIVAGDSFAIEHLGIDPRSDEWRLFVRGALNAQFHDEVGRAGENLIQSIITLSRDSVRCALQLTAKALQESEYSPEATTAALLSSLKNNQILSAQKTLPGPLHDFGGIIRKARDQVKLRTGSAVVRTAVELRLTLPAEAAARGERMEYTDAVLSALRCGAMAMPSGVPWIPGSIPEVVEFSPVPLWDPEDGLWTYPAVAKGSAPPAVRLEWSAADVDRFRAARRAYPIFIGYRFRAAESRQFRTDIAKAIAGRSRGDSFPILDGHVDSGVEWASEIRRRIRESVLMVADLTGLRKEVLVESGLAYGLGKYLIPVVDSDKLSNSIPLWVRSRQIGTFGSRSGLTRLANQIVDHAKHPRSGPRPKSPSPRVVGWLGGGQWADSGKRQVAALCLSEGLEFKIEHLENPESAIETSCRAGIIIACFDGTDDDWLVHYCSGILLARVYAAAAGKLLRRLVIVEPPSRTTGSLRRSSAQFVADSLVHTRATVAITDIAEVHRFVKEYVSRLLEWDERMRKEPES